MKEITKEEFKKLCDNGAIDLIGHDAVLWAKVQNAEREIQARQQRTRQIQAEAKRIELEVNNQLGQAFAYFDLLFERVHPTLEKMDQGDATPHTPGVDDEEAA